MPPSPPSPAVRQSRVVRTVKSIPRNQLVILGSLTVLFIICVFMFLRHNWNEVIAVVSPLEAGKSDTVRIYDRNDKIVCTISGNEDRVPVPLKQISPFMQKAVVAAEDHAFYQHHGINPESIARAAFVNIKSGRVREGGSTITQQLAKTLYSEGEDRTFTQKIKESMIAWQLENRYSKDRILESYLNQVYFGRGAYGIERASELYFAKPASKLSLGEAAFLTGLINAPSTLSRADNRDDAVDRQAMILDQMVECDFADKATVAKAKVTKLNVRASAPLDSYYLYYVDAVMAEMRTSIDPSKTNIDGLSIYTNMDPAAQKAAVTAINKGVKRAPRGVRQAALASISVKDGSVVALVGGAGNFWKHQYNRATNPHTVGSAFKPFVYLAGILAGVLKPDTVLYDEPITITGSRTQPYSPRNFDRGFMGALTVRDALARSRNVCAVKVAVDTGIDKVIEVAKLAGVLAPLEPNLSLALGSCAVSPLEMASAYSTFARGGVAIHPRLIRNVKDLGGKVLFEESIVEKPVFDPEANAELVDLLQSVVKQGTATGAQLGDRPVAGKTGTADQAKDLWFVGFTPDLATATWGGNDENNAIPGSSVTGGSVMAGIWRDYMQSYYKSHSVPPGQFAPPATPMDTEVHSTFASIGDGIGDGIEREVVDTVDDIEKEVHHKKKGIFRSVGRLFKSLFH